MCFRLCRSIVKSALLAAALVCVAGEVRAQESSYSEKKADDGQSVVFKDDPLSAVTDQAIGAQLTGFHPPHRFQLIRPRGTFVPELLKSVEAL
jgi:hypothetical protein